MVGPSDTADEKARDVALGHDIDDFLGERGFDKERWIAAEIRDRMIKSNKNAICIWVGPTGGGKSYSALRLAELVDPGFNLDRLVFRPSDFLDFINNPGIKRGSVIVWDEMGLGMPAREWNSVFNKSIGYVLQSFRYKNLALFMTVPDEAFIDAQARRLFHYYFECVNVDSKKEQVLAKPLQFQHSARFNKDYAKYPIAHLSTGPAKVGSLCFNLPSSSLRQSYETKRKTFMDSYYVELRESMDVSGESGVPLWAWKAILILNDKYNQAEIAGLLGVSFQWVSKLMKKARSATRIIGLA